MKTIAQIIHHKSFPIYIDRADGRTIYYEDSSGRWLKLSYDENGIEIYCENSAIVLRDDR